MDSKTGTMDPIELLVTGILPEAKDTITITLERTDGKPLVYESGQFLTLLLPGQGHELRRSYSFSSASGIDSATTITVKRVINGEASRYLQDHLRVGDRLQSLPASGRFTLEAAPGHFFIAAGSGLVPVFSLLKTALSQEAGGSVILLTQFHDPGDILFRKELEALVQEHGERFRWFNLLSGEMPGTAAGPVTHRSGRLNNWLLEELLGELLFQKELASALKAEDEQHTQFYICGPQPFMRMAIFTLRLAGISPERIKKENFTVEFVPPPPLLTDKSPKLVRLRIGGRMEEYETAWPKTILQSALDRHIQLPYSCKGGRCSTCIAKCLSGEVVMSINEVLTEKDIRAGLVLTCVGYAKTDVLLEYE